MAIGGRGLRVIQLRIILMGFLYCALLIPARGFGQGAKVSSPVELARVAATLKPGEWVWAPDVAPDGPLLIYVDLSRQRATVYRNGVRIGVTTISSGKKHHETPTGVFTILQKQTKHKSTLYHSAPMPYMERLTWDGVALHAGGLPGYPESHGCIHLPYAFSQELFKVTSLGATVVVAGDAASQISTEGGGLIAPMDAAGTSVDLQHLDGEQFFWAPEKSPSGPLTIILSKHDERIVVLRNGVEIGRSVAQINDDDPGSHVLSLTVGDDGQQHWIYVGLSGHPEDEGRALDEATANRVHMPRKFYEALSAELQPGATVLVTQSSVGTTLTGRRETILDGVAPKP